MLSISDFGVQTPVKPPTGRSFARQTSRFRPSNLPPQEAFARQTSHLRGPKKPFARQTSHLTPVKPPTLRGSKRAFARQTSRFRPSNLPLSPVKPPAPSLQGWPGLEPSVQVAVR